jgi:hypothetical protein
LRDAYLRGADLSGADLSGADLSGADLSDADLRGADLSDADLRGAYLRGAYLRGADLSGAYLRGAYLRGADLRGADLSDADLRGAKNVPNLEKLPPPDYAAVAKRFRKRHPEVPVVVDLDRRILDAVTTGGGALEMSRWHTCQTTHCRAGWAIMIAGEPGRKLEDKYGPFRAGAMLYKASTGRLPDFFADNDDALADIKACVGVEA